MRPEYVKLVVLRAAIRGAWEVEGGKQARREYIVKYCEDLEKGFKRAHNFSAALVCFTLAHDIRYAHSLMEIFRAVEQDAINVLFSGLVPQSNTGPTDVVEEQGDDVQDPSTSDH